ncbi:MAG: dynamin family protein [Actinomycetales bacterium]|nr:dynamin family protein [Actinomycetales bacterium]
MPGPRRPAAEELVHRLEQGRLRAVVLGEANRGKSTLVNALLGRPVMPTGVVPVTTVITDVVHGDEDGLDVRFLDGSRREYGLGDLASLVTEDANPANQAGIASVTVRLRAPLLATGIELVDTPGIGSVFDHNTASAREAMRSMDVAVLVLTADAPMSSAERDLLAAAAGTSIRILCVLNKVDYLDEGDREQALAFVARNVKEALGAQIPIFACSAREPESPGLAALSTALLSGTDPTKDLVTSVAAAAIRLAAASLDDLAVAAATLAAEDEQSRKQLDRFRDRLARTTRRSDRITDRVESLSRGLLHDLDDTSAVTSARLRRQVDEILSAAFSGNLAQTPTPALEDEARALVADALRPGLDHWRDTGRRQLDDGLTGIADELSRDLETDLGDVRQAARDLIGLDLVLDAPRVSLPADHGFLHTLSPAPGQTELTARALRRRTPGVLGRRWIENRVRADARRLADAQVGRVRADLQERLTEATRVLARRCADQHAESLDRLGEAMRTAAAARSGRHDDVATTRTGLAADQAAVAGLIEALRELRAEFAPEGQR